MSRFISLDGVVEIKDSETEDTFIDSFVEFVESHGWYFGGGCKDVTNES